ncbi:hypothetical protein PIB30_073982 [Stylosanthes scabra]|uniref:C2H2-type domain-containing protein n=1 Tax=Stylosanthes scabra TaxID=79078 RepID=A0ABU6QP99_9FABA|nr:hypothetical protein [Stylosanthes scabra]
MPNNFYNNNGRQGLFNYGQHPLPPNNNHQNPLSCRICHQIFPSFQALITHSSSHHHLVQENNNIFRGRQSSSFSPNLMNNPQRQCLINPSPHRRLVASSYQPRLTRASPYPYTTTTNATTRPSWRRFPPELMPSSTLSYVNEMARLASSSSTPLIHHQEEIMEVSRVDGTRALIDKLNKPIVKNPFVNLFDLNNDPTLNLELNL